MSVDKNNFNESFKPLNDCTFITENNDILVKVTGDDPYFESTFPFTFDKYDTVILMIDLESKSASDLQIFYGLKQNPGILNINTFLHFIYTSRYIYHISLTLNAWGPLSPENISS